MSSYGLYYLTQNENLNLIKLLKEVIGNVKIGVSVYNHQYTVVYYEQENSGKEHYSYPKLRGLLFYFNTPMLFVFFNEDKETAGKLEKDISKIAKIGKVDFSSRLYWEISDAIQDYN